MNLQESLSRRQAVRLGAAGMGFAFVPFLGERGRASAQETQSPNNQEGRVIMPDPEGRPQFIEAFNQLIDGNMKPKGLELLGMTPILADMDLTPGANFSMEKLTEFDEDDEVRKPGVFVEGRSVNYAFHIYDPVSLKNYKASPFLASYVTYIDSSNMVDHRMAFNIGPDGKLREKGNTDKLPYDSLKSVPEKYFNFFDPAITTWFDYEQADPQAAGQAVQGGTPDFVERDGVLKAFHVLVGINGTVLYSSASMPPDAIKDKQEALRRVTTNMKRFQKRISRFNTPQV